MFNTVFIDENQIFTLQIFAFIRHAHEHKRDTRVCETMPL